MALRCVWKRHHPTPPVTLAIVSPRILLVTNDNGPAFAHFPESVSHVAPLEDATVVAIVAVVAVIAVIVVVVAVANAVIESPVVVILVVLCRPLLLCHPSLIALHWLVVALPLLSLIGWRQVDDGRRNMVSNKTNEVDHQQRAY